MKYNWTYKTVRQLVALREEDMARVNHEYQRGAVWKTDQRKKLVDSVMRRYPLPVIYLHYKRSEVDGMVRESYDIIDGQQRIDSLHQFAKGGFTLYKADDKDARFPRFIQEAPDSWGSKNIDSLSDELRERFLETEIPVAYIECDDDNEVRDLFVRLQSGFPLNRQERRDAYPGNFTEAILRLGGKPDPELARVRYAGHPFFQRVLGMRPASDRGKTRQLAAQITMLFLERRRFGSDHFVDTNANAIDDYYYQNLDFDIESAEFKRLNGILDKLTEVFAEKKGPKLRVHDAIHLTLFVDSLWDDYTRGWEPALRDAHWQFSKALSEATAAYRRADDPGEMWLEYGMLLRSNADSSESIRRRHRYFALRMVDLLGTRVVRRDPKRSFDALEAEIIYNRDKGLCRDCGGDVRWREAEIHHVTPHSQGGKTEVRNGVLVHAHCHPKSAEAVRRLAEKVWVEEGLT